MNEADSSRAKGYSMMTAPGFKRMIEHRLILILETVDAEEGDAPRHVPQMCSVLQRQGCVW